MTGLTVQVEFEEKSFAVSFLTRPNFKEFNFGILSRLGLEKYSLGESYYTFYRDFEGDLRVIVSEESLKQALESCKGKVLNLVLCSTEREEKEVKGMNLSSFTTYQHLPKKVYLLWDFTSLPSSLKAEEVVRELKLLCEKQIPGCETLLEVFGEECKVQNENLLACGNLTPLTLARKLSYVHCDLILLLTSNPELKKSVGEVVKVVVIGGEQIPRLLQENNEVEIKASPASEHKEVCSHFIRGKCSYGDDCYKLHPKSASTHEYSRNEIVGGSPRILCSHFLEGRCGYGNSCYKAHVILPSGIRLVKEVSV